MKKIIIWILLNINSLLKLLYISPIQGFIGKYSKQEAGAIGVIGRVDGETAMFLSSHINMKKIIIWILLIINSLLILLYISPIQGIIGKYSKQEAGAIGVIGGVDGETAIFLSSHINWYLIIIIVLEIVFITYLCLRYLKKE